MDRFILADNQDITQAGLRWLIDKSLGETLIEEVANKKELIARLVEGEQAVVVLDYALFDFGDVEELLVLEKRFPETRWILFSNELSEGLIRRLSLEPAISLVLKESPADEICSALRCARQGERFLCHQVTNLLLVGVKQPKEEALLTPTETEILKLIAHGKSVKEIAALRNSSVHTITTHKKNIFRKLEVNNVFEATKYAIRSGLVELVEYYI